MKFDSLETIWKSFSKVVIPDVSKVQHDEMKKAFFSGALIILNICDQLGDDEVTEDKAVEYLSSLDNECKTLMQSMLIEHIQRN